MVMSMITKELNSETSLNPYIQIEESSNPKKRKESIDLLRSHIEAIGKSDPEKASLLSRKVVFWDGTQKQLDELKKEGLEVSYLSVNRLKGGGLEDLIGEAFAKGVDILINGNKQEMEEKLDPEMVIEAKMSLPGVGEEKGDYTGNRKVALKAKHFLGDTYTLYATGSGKFISKTVSYIGDFFDNVFHDHTGKAIYHIGHKIKYTGGFSNGQREGIGVLELWHGNNWYQAFEGEWHGDKPWQGVAKTVEGVKISVTEGHFSKYEENSENLQQKILGKDDEKDLQPTQEKKIISTTSIAGLNLEAICKTENKYITLPIGKGSYDLGDLLYKSSCPDCKKGVEEIENLFLKNCTYSIEAKKRNKEMLNVSNQVVTELKIDVSDFLHATISTK